MSDQVGNQNVGFLTSQLNFFFVIENAVSNGFFYLCSSFVKTVFNTVSYTDTKEQELKYFCIGYHGFNE